MDEKKCAYCRIKAAQDSLEKGEQITIRRNDERHGFDLFKHPKKKLPWEHGDKYLIDHLMEITRECICED